MLGKLKGWLKLLIHKKSIFYRKLILFFPGRPIYKMFSWKIESNRISQFLNLSFASSSTDTFEIPFTTKKSEMTKSNRNFGLLFPPLVERSHQKVQGDMWFAYSESLTESGNSFTDMSSILDPALFDEPSISKVISSFVELGVQSVIVDANSAITKPSLLEKKLEIMRHMDLAIIVDIPDLYKCRGGVDKLTAWMRIANLVIIHNSRLLVSGQKKNILLWPGFPFPESKYSIEWSAKGRDLSIMGYGHRQRDLFVKQAIRHKLMTSNSLHSNTAQENLEYFYMDYISRLRDTRISFANGFINLKESIVVGRAIESILSNSLLLYEDGSDLDYFLTPYSDYIPVYNLPDFIEKVLYFQNNPHHAEIIAKRGLLNLKTQYSSGSFWREVQKIF